MSVEKKTVLLPIQKTRPEVEPYAVTVEVSEHDAFVPLSFIGMCDMGHISNLIIM